MRSSDCTRTASKLPCPWQKSKDRKPRQSTPGYAEAAFTRRLRAARLSARPQQYLPRRSDFRLAPEKSHVGVVMAPNSLRIAVAPKGIH
jgi:hypothetical protein